MHTSTSRRFSRKAPYLSPILSSLWISASVSSIFPCILPYCMTHMGGLLENQYRTQSRCLSTTELREYLLRTFSPEQFYCGSSNERFRRQMYDIYLGGLDGEKFSISKRPI